MTGRGWPGWRVFLAGTWAGFRHGGAGVRGSVRFAFEDVAAGWRWWRRS